MEKFEYNDIAILAKLDDYASNRSKKLLDLKNKNLNKLIVFEDWWIYKTDIIKSILDLKKGIYSKKYYARKLKIKDVNSDDAKKFLNENHLQGYCPASIRYGLYNDEELIQIITIGKVRYTKNAEYELLRLATKKRTVVVGGTERLFKHFLKIYNNPSIISYCDNSIFNGNIYSKLGFTLIKTEPGYSYYGNDKKRIHRSSFQKHKLAKKFNISENEVKTEYETCIKNGYKRIWDCGQSTWMFSPLSMKEKIQKNICEKYDITFLDNFDKVFCINSDGVKTYKKYYFKCNKCGFKWEQGIRFDRNLSCPKCFPFEHGSSKGELELYNYFLTTELKIEHNNREVLNGKEIDIYIPELSVGIEYDGEYWHNEEEDLKKEQLCLQKNIKLYRVKDSEWIDNKYNILSFFEKELNIKFEEIKEIATLTNKAKKVIDLSTLRVYNSAKEAALDLGIKESGNINNVCNGSLDRIDGRKFEYYNDNKKYFVIKRKLGYHTKKVQCIETNEVFETLTEAINKYGKSIWDCLNGKQKTAYKMHWKYVE